jgi:mannose-6-phosphate isomerase
MIPIRGTVQHYDWGDPTFIPRFLGLEPDGRPWAELWLGTHPNGPASLADGSPLSDLTGDLPYLFKVLSAAKPLSLQTHPDRTRAERGYAAGRYPDPNPKPELLCALTPFEAFCGIRPVAATIELFERLELGGLTSLLTNGGPGAALEAIYHRQIELDPIIAACHQLDTPETRWALRLEEMYPGEPSVAATLLLNHVRLEPGEAIHLGAGNLHAYLAGSGLELMGASDNVIRGGLTTKPVDIDELLEVVDPSPLERPVMRRAHRYHLENTPVVLERIEAGHSHLSKGHELGIGLDGSTWYLPAGETITPSGVSYVVTSA